MQEEKISSITSVTALLSEGLTPEDILYRILGKDNTDILDKLPVSFKCDCSREKVENALILLSEDDLQEIIDEGKPVEVKCHFCNKSYSFDTEELIRMKKQK